MTTGYGARTLGIVIFTLESSEFGVHIERVREVDRVLPITRVPRVPPYVEGVSNLRGQLLPIIDLRTRLGLPRMPPTKASRIIVTDVDVGVGARRIGLLVDAVREVVRVPFERVETTPEILSELAMDCIRGVAKQDDRLIMLLDLDKVVAAEIPLEGLEASVAKDQL